MRLVFFGSGHFGVPTLDRLHRSHEVVLVVTQPDRGTGRGRQSMATPIGQFAADHDLPVQKPDDPNTSEAIDAIRGTHADAFVVIAYGHKLSPDLLGDTFAINLHASLLPKYRGAAPINHAVINQETHTGVSVITLAQRMDAGDVLATVSTKIDPMETAGELHDRLALLGPDVVGSVLEQYAAGEVQSQSQDDAQACPAPKFNKADGTVDFDQPAAAVRARVHGLTPWPGCTVVLNDTKLKLLRVRDIDDGGHAGAPGEVLGDGTIACNPGRVQLLSVQPAGGRQMTFAAYMNGRQIAPGMKVTPLLETVTDST